MILASAKRAEIEAGGGMAPGRVVAYRGHPLPVLEPSSEKAIT
jgi:hypothetical protein